MNKENLIPGVWYKNIGSNKNFMAPFAGFAVSGGWLYNEKHECISSRKYTIDMKCTTVSHKWDEAEPCTREDLIKYLPEGHLDRPWSPGLPAGILYYPTIPEYIIN